MSFDYNPFDHIDVLHRPHGNVRLRCHGCGGVWGDWTTEVPARVLFESMASHLISSHRITRSFAEHFSLH